jgi:hypothetical protein
VSRPGTEACRHHARGPCGQGGGDCHGKMKAPAPFGHLVVVGQRVKRARPEPLVPLSAYVPMTSAAQATFPMPHAAAGPTLL